MRIVFDVNVVHPSSGGTLGNARVVIQKVVYSCFADNRLQVLFTSTARCFPDNCTIHQIDFRKNANHDELLVVRLLDNRAMFGGNYVVLVVDQSDRGSDTVYNTTAKAIATSTNSRPILSSKLELSAPTPRQ